VVDLPLAFPFAILQGVLVLGWVLPAAVIPIQALKLLGNRSPILEMRPKRSLPPLQLALGVRPSQAANCRPDVN
jgi:hypothetical protein